MATRPATKPKHPLELAAKRLRAGGTLSVPWVLPLDQLPFRTFESLQEWLEALVSLDLDQSSAIPTVVREKYLRALKVYLAAWVDADILVIAEAAAYGAMELAVRDQYGERVRALQLDRKTQAAIGKSHPAPKCAPKSPPPEEALPQFADEPQPPPLSALLDYMVRHDGLSDAKARVGSIPIARTIPASLSLPHTKAAPPFSGLARGLVSRDKRFGAALSAKSLFSDGLSVRLRSRQSTLNPPLRGGFRLSRRLESRDLGIRPD